MTDAPGSILGPLILAILSAALPDTAGAEGFSQTQSFDTDATVDVGRIATCLRTPHGDPRQSIGFAAHACRKHPPAAADPTYAGLRCDYAEMNFWQGVLEENVAHLQADLRGESLRAFTTQQDHWQSDNDYLCGFPFTALDAPLWPEQAEADCRLHDLANRAIAVKAMVDHHLAYCEFPPADLRPGFACK